jgi:hypothetical protein
MKTKSKTSPKGGKRGCLCDNGTYSKECCNGDLQNQGRRCNKLELIALQLQK